MGDGRESLFLQILDGLGMGGERPALCQLKVEHRNIQPAPGADLGVLLAQGASSSVAGIGHQGLSLQLQPVVDLLKNGAGHIHLAPDDEPGQLFRQDHGNGANGAQIPGDILALAPIAPGGALIEHAVPVFQSHGQAVYLGLHAVFRPGQGFQHLGQEILNLTSVEYVLQALQRDGVHHLRKIIQRGVPHPLGGGVRGDLLRVLPLQVLQTAVKAIVFKVADGGIVQHIIAVAVGVQSVPQLLHLGLIVHNPLILCS